MALISNNTHGTISRNQSIYYYENSNVKLGVDEFNTITTSDGKEEKIKRFTLTNENGMSVDIINYGATITSINVPNKDGKVEDVVLGFDDMKGYQSSGNPYFGCIVGRVANRIGKGRFELEGKEYNVTLNRGIYHLHGGEKGFDKKVWNSHLDGNRLMFTYLSECGEEGYPGHVLVQATYQLTPENELILDMTATSTKPTPINLTNHSYFNLAGHNKGRRGIVEQNICINADRYTEVDNNSIPTGEFIKVGGTAMDLRVQRNLGEVLKATGGIDHNYCVNQCSRGGLTFVARVDHPPSGRTMEVHSDQPGVQLYTANFLPCPDTCLTDSVLIGKKGVKYEKQGALCLETQNFPDAVNHPNFPNSILNPGYTYAHNVVYRFGVLNKE